MTTPNRPAKVAFSAVFDDKSDLIYNVAFRRTGSWERPKIVSMVFPEKRNRAQIEALADDRRPSNAMPTPERRSEDIDRSQIRGRFRLG